MSNLKIVNQMYKDSLSRKYMNHEDDRHWVGYLDLLGFKNHTRNSQNSAMQMLDEYQNILLSGMEIDEGLGFKCNFRHVLPFSDSLFLVGDIGSNFFSNLGQFLNQCWITTGSVYCNINNAGFPSMQWRKRMGKEFLILDEDNDSPPLLFRGGVSYGQVFHKKCNGLIEKKNVETFVLHGKSVVDAVKLEENGKGPRIFLSTPQLDEFRKSNKNKVDIEDRYFCKIEDSKLHEYLWPAATNDRDGLISMLNGAVNLWVLYAHEASIAQQYWEFIRLIVKSAQISLTHQDMVFFKNKLDELDILWRLLDIIK